MNNSQIEPKCQCQTNHYHSDLLWDNGLMVLVDEKARPMWWRENAGTLTDEIYEAVKYANVWCPVCGVGAVVEKMNTDEEQLYCLVELGPVKTGHIIRSQSMTRTEAAIKNSQLYVIKWVARSDYNDELIQKLKLNPMAYRS